MATYRVAGAGLPSFVCAMATIHTGAECEALDDSQHVAVRLRFISWEDQAGRGVAPPPRL